MEIHYLKKELYTLVQKDLSLFEFIQRGSLDGIWYWDLENPENEWMSSSFWTTLGYDPKGKKHLASEWQDLIHPEDLQVATENFKKHCADPNYPYDQVVRYRHKDGSTVWVRCRGIAIRDKAGNPIRMLGAHTDLTQQKIVEHLLKKTNENLEARVLERTSELKQINEQLNQELKARSKAEKRLRASEEKYRSMMEAMDDAAYICSSDFRIEYINPAMGKEFGYDVMGELCHKGIFGLNEICPWCTHANTSEGKHSKYEAVSPKSTKTYHISSSPIHHADSSISILTILHDITGIKKMDLQLRKANRSLRALSRCNEMVMRATTETELLQAICTILVQDGEYRMAWVGFSEQNESKGIYPAAHAGFEQDYLESLKLTWADTERGRGPSGTAIRTRKPSICNNIQSDPKFAPWRDEAIKRGYASCISLPLITNGDAFGVLSLYAEQSNAFDREERKLLIELSNNLAYGISHIRLRIERDLAEKALNHSKGRYKKLYIKSRKSAELYRSFFNASPDAIAIYDLQGRTHYINPMFSRTFGWTLEDVKGKRIPFVPDSEKLATMQTIRAIVENGTPCIGFETARLTKSGRILDVSISAARFNDHRGQPAGIIVIQRDISERKRLEKHLIQAQKMEAIGTLAGGIAHDFNNILSAVIGFTQLAMDGVENDSLTQSNLQDVLNAAQRAKELVYQILTFSRQDERERKPINVRHIAKEVLKLIRASLPTTIEIRDNIKSNSPVDADPTRIHQVLMNLCTNAGHAMQENGGTLKVELSDTELDSDFTDRYPDLTPGPFLKLTVSDTGCGMPAHVLERIFDPFFTTKTDSEGTGMGLSVVHGIVKSHGGAINAYSEPGRGTTFNIFLPVIETEIAPEKTREELIPTGSERILFVDDDKVLVKMGRQLLESLGYEVTTRTSSIEALELFKTHPDRFDLVITDMTMPGITGDKMAQEMMRIRQDIPIILCTGFSARIDEEKAKAMGIRVFVPKPIVKGDIARKIRMALGQPV